MPFALDSLLAIEIPWDPNITRLGGFLLTWHGLFTAVGIFLGVQIALRMARRIDYDEDQAYTIALVAVPGGIIGARLLFVIERWDYFSANLPEIIAITEGGISIWGGILGGVISGVAFAAWRGYPVARTLDIGAFGLILGQAIGRIGDLINGEHLARPTDLPWAVYYTHPDSPAFAHSLTAGPHHPATTYELLGDLVILGALFWVFRGPFRRRPGLTFCVYFLSYATMRFFLTFLRLDSPEVIGGLVMPQVISLLTIAVGIGLLAYFWSRPPEADPADAPPPPGRVPVRR